MNLILAFKAFMKALRNPNEGEEFLNNSKKIVEKGDVSHLRLLSLLQQSGRLIDFFEEDIEPFTDAQVGAAVRGIHKKCRELLKEYVTISSVMEEKEGEEVRIPKGYDPSMIKVIGKVKGEPPFVGKLVHKGWKAHKRTLPKQVGCQACEIIYPAEVEIH